MRLGILGGSFNPVHVGHLFLADTVISKLKLDRIVFVPANKSPFKLDNTMESSADRLTMLAATIAGDSRYAIDDCELRREGVSYTVDTVQDIIERYRPKGKPALIIGDDIANEFPKWRDSDKILQLADIVVARRISTAGNGLKVSYPHTIIDNEAMDISSNMIRQRIKEESESGSSTAVVSGGWRSLVPPAVRAIIEDKKLYGFHDDSIGRERGIHVSSEDCTQSIIQRIETAACETLSMDRFLHSRNTALMAGDMCRRFGCDPAAGYLAGIAHDLAKQIDNKQMIKIVKNAKLEITDLEKEKPNLLHGKAASVLLRERFFIHNEDVIEAVACHTSGSENMGLLAKIVYIADKTESSRNIDPALREMCMTCNDLDKTLYAVLEKTIIKLQAKKLDLSEDTLKLLNKIKGKN
ncbi:MAG: nicotinate (nicotinamide) nucleotide adenylyltransferase [Treponema sp.]|nr:nicotinate (nicotinamide) nucleotide adenylyltransferase [Treponema sp.]